MADTQPAAWRSFYTLKAESKKHKASACVPPAPMKPSSERGKCEGLRGAKDPVAVRRALYSEQDYPIGTP